MPYFNIVAETNENTVVKQYEPVKKRSDAYQSEAELEKEFIRMLTEQGYEYLQIHTEEDLVANIRAKLEELNEYKFSDTEWERFFKECIANGNDGPVEKTCKIQEDNVQVLKRDDNMTKNITLIDRKNIHNNRLQVINQYVVTTEQGARHDNRYDVTVLVNGFPLVHIELKRRGVPIREAFNQINRYERDSFSAGYGLFEYVQIYVISNGTNTKYYSNSTRYNAIRDAESANTKKGKTSNSFEFTSFWADANNHVMQRIYGVCFPTAEELEEHLKLLEEAKDRDHRKIGKEMHLFMSDDLVGRGLPMFLPKGYTVWQELENYIKAKERKLGYLHVMTPCVGTVNLYKTSGHWDHYKENMFPAMEVEGESFVLRPMNCPHHMMIYANRMHSYKDLPIRIGEIAHDFRFEASGTLKGIERGRHFCQNDAHLFVTPEQIESEFAKVVELIFDTYKDFNITDYRCVLSLRDPEDKVKYHDDDEMWNNAENALRKVLDDIGIEYTEEIGEAAFYGPKLDVNVKPAIGNEYTLSTCQLDFCLPAKFNLSYIDSDGTKKTPVVLHRAILGSLDRFMAYILEETKGNLPLWLAPVQAKILPVKNEDEELNAYSHDLYKYLDDSGIRVEIDERNEKLGYRIREAQMEKVPYLLVLGKNEAADGTVSYRLHGEQNSTTVSREDFLALLKEDIRTKKINPAALK